MENASAFFPGRVPTRAETEGLFKNCREMERLEERMRAEMLSEEEQERLTVLEDFFAQGSDSGSTEKKSLSYRERKMSPRKSGTTAFPAGLFSYHVGALLILAAVL